MPFETFVFNHRAYFMEVKECDDACVYNPKRHRRLVQSLPPELPMEQCLATFVSLRDELLATSVAQQYEVRIFKADSAGKACEHEGGEYVAGGGVAPTYNARLTTREEPMGKWLMQFFTKLTQHTTDQADMKFQIFHDMLDLLRRALGGFHVLRRKGWFATPKTKPDVQVEFVRMLYKCLPHSQYATSDDQYLPVYRSACQAKFAPTGLRAKLTFEIIWAAISEQAQIPHTALAYHCVNDKRVANACEQRRANGAPTSSASAAASAPAA